MFKRGLIGEKRQKNRTYHGIQLFFYLVSNFQAYINCQGVALIWGSDRIVLTTDENIFSSFLFIFILFPDFLRFFVNSQLKNWANLHQFLAK